MIESDHKWIKQRYTTSLYDQQMQSQFHHTNTNTNTNTDI